MILRLSLTLLTLLAIIALPWWASLFLIFLLIFYFPWYYEAVFLVGVFDLLYGTGIMWLVIGAVIIVPLSEELKKTLYVFN